MKKILGARSINFRLFLHKDLLQMKKWYKIIENGIDLNLIIVYILNYCVSCCQTINEIKFKSRQKLVNKKNEKNKAHRA